MTVVLVPPIFFLEVPAYLFLGIWFVGHFLMARMAAFDSPYAVNVAYWSD